MSLAMPVCDIVIPVWNQAEATEGCLESIKNNTATPYRLIIVDNASGKDTRDFLESFAKDNKDLPIKLVRNEKNVGFIKAVNTGIKLATAEYVCILNNDTIVTDGWLEEMLILLAKNPDIGVVNPSSNSLGQRVPAGRTLEEHSRDAKEESGSFVELGSALGFCMLVRQSLFAEIGLFDEAYGMGNYDDTDFSIRAKLKGYKAVRAIGSYVYHKEGASFNFLKNYTMDFKKNKALFEKKWGRTKRVVIIFKEINNANLVFLRNVLKENVKEKTWVYVISPLFDTKEFFESFSNLSFYHTKGLFYLPAFFKTVFRKKEADLIYADSDIFLKSLSLFMPYRRITFEKIKA